jgi:hypothetical protein
MDLVDLARTNPDFKRRARVDLEGTLSEYGYELTGEELAAVKEYHRSTLGMSDAEVEPGAGPLCSRSRDAWEVGLHAVWCAKDT